MGLGLGEMVCYYKNDIVNCYMYVFFIIVKFNNNNSIFSILKKVLFMFLLLFIE